MFLFKIEKSYSYTCHFQTAITSKKMTEKGLGWLHSLRLIELFADHTNFLKIDSAELGQNNKTKLFLFFLVIVTRILPNTMADSPHPKYFSEQSSRSAVKKEKISQNSLRFCVFFVS
jgi:hypothetical protein